MMAGLARMRILSLTRQLASLGLGGRRHTGSSAVPAKVLPYRKTRGDDDDVNMQQIPDDFRVVFPEFLPDPKPEWRNRLREKLERQDMLARRAVMAIPEFYVGSIMGVTVADPNASGKINRFVGICIQRGGTGLRAWFILRNVIDHQGKEIICIIYLYEFSTGLGSSSSSSGLSGAVEGLGKGDDGKEMEELVWVQLKPRPWHERWERKNLQGLLDLGLPERFYKRAKLHEKPWEKFDLMKEYRATIPEEEQADIFREISPHYEQLEASRRRAKRRRTKIIRS
nr:39S ribosomal protein L19, mitochondrial-like [Cherax quadricarinatus]